MTDFPDLGRLVDRLALEFPLLDEQDIRAVVAEIAADYREARVLQYVSIFVERESRERLARTAVPRPRRASDPHPVA